jgi:endonuclease/exonuclease/phosphatase family metal-dependent hydrolase
LFGAFMAATGLADAFGGGCPATFRAEYLPAGATAHCIDFILTAGGVTADSAALVFAGKEPLGYVSDHTGLRARLSLMPWHRSQLSRSQLSRGQRTTSKTFF